MVHGSWRITRAHTNWGVQQRSLLRRVLGRVLETAFEKVLRRVLIFIHLQCWEVLPFCRFQRQRCIKILCPKDPDFYTPLALKTAKGQHLPALEVRRVLGRCLAVGLNGKKGSEKGF